MLDYYTFIQYRIIKERFSAIFDIGPIMIPNGDKIKHP